MYRLLYYSNLNPTCDSNVEATFLINFLQTLEQYSRAPRALFSHDNLNLCLYLDVDLFIQAVATNLDSDVELPTQVELREVKLVMPAL